VDDQEARYDRIAEGYARWWSPIHRPATLAVLDALAPSLDDGASRLLDVGCGTGALAAAAVARWPGVRVTGIDVSAGMLAVAERELATLRRQERERIRLVRAPADRLPFPGGSFDLAVSTFVLQLVPNPHRALREARRVLAPGGTLVFATWLVGGSFAADAAYRDALEAAGIDGEDDGGDDGDPRSPADAAARLRRAGFERVTAAATEVDHAFTPASYLAFMTRFDDADLWDSLPASQRRALAADVRARLEALPEEALRMRLPVAIAAGRRTRRP
jgi:SAM-dependent methyltransferase